MKTENEINTQIEDAELVEVLVNAFDFTEPFIRGLDLSDNRDIGVYDTMRASMEALISRIVDEDLRDDMEMELQMAWRTPGD